MSAQTKEIRWGDIRSAVHGELWWQALRLGAEHKDALAYIKQQARHTDPELAAFKQAQLFVGHHKQLPDWRCDSRGNFHLPLGGRRAIWANVHGPREESAAKREVQERWGRLSHNMGYFFIWSKGVVGCGEGSSHLYLSDEHGALRLIDRRQDAGPPQAYLPDFQAAAAFHLGSGMASMSGRQLRALVRAAGNRPYDFALKSNTPREDLEWMLHGGRSIGDLDATRFREVALGLELRFEQEQLMEAHRTRERHQRWKRELDARWPLTNGL